ncbi:MAG: TonB-dependent siderophore receptor [Methylocystis sp.]
MFRSTLLHGVSVGALALVSSSVLAQQTLPTIDVRAAAARPPRANVPGLAGDGRQGVSTKDRPGSSQKGAGLGGRFTGYTVDLDTPAMVGKTNTPILQTPTAIQVVTRETMDDQQSTSVLDAVVSNVSSVAIAGNQFYDRFIIRGFDVGRNVYRNGLRVAELTNLEIANLQSIEVLKGPAAMLYGRIEPGGLINLVPKRPLLDPYYSVHEQTGSFGYTKTTVDATGPLNADKSLAYRFNGAYLNTGSHRDFIQRENVFLAPTLTWRPDDRFTLNIDGEYQNLGFSADAFNAIPAIGRRPASVPIYRDYAEPSLTLAKPNRQERLFIAYDATLKLTDTWKIVNRFSYWNLNFLENDTITSGFNVNTGMLTRSQYFIPNGNQRTLSTNLDLLGEFATGPFKHEILLGGDYYQASYNRLGFFGRTQLLQPINIWWPVYSNIGISPLYALQQNNFDIFKENWQGVYGQDQISFMDDQVHLLLGGRYDSTIVGRGFSSLSRFDANMAFRNVPAKAFSPRVGLVIQPLRWLSFYTNYSRSFGVSNGLAQDGSVLPPQKASQFEGGIKSELLDKRLSASVAYYVITKTNVLARVPGTTFSRPIGEAESNGFEMDVEGRIDDNWSLIANYSFTKARVTKDNSAGGGLGNTGNRLPNVPLHSGNVWIKYDSDGMLKGLSVAGGVNVVGERKGDVANTFELPGYALLNGMLSYSVEPLSVPWVKLFTAQVNVNNILNTTHYLAANSRFSIIPGAPRSFLVSLRAEF